MDANRDWSTCNPDGVCRLKGKECAFRYTAHMQFLTISRRRVDAFPPEAFTAELLRGETNRVRELYSQGLLRQVWKRADMPGAAILWETASQESAREAVQSLPLFKAGLLEIVALLPLEPYPGFGAA
jgi:muconolactone delta-isomerase